MGYKLGTEAKCVADRGSSAMRFLEIQERKNAMALKRYRRDKGVFKKFPAAIALVMRLEEGVRGFNFVFPEAAASSPTARERLGLLE